MSGQGAGMLPVLSSDWGWGGGSGEAELWSGAHRRQARMTTKPSVSSLLLNSSNTDGSWYPQLSFFSF